MKLTTVVLALMFLLDSVAAAQTPLVLQIARNTPAGFPSVPVFIDRILEECGPSRMSTGGQAILAEQIERATRLHMRGLAPYSFVASLCLETRMGSRKGVSSAGAVGISQLMWETAKTEARRCGYGEIRPEDLQQDELNLRIAACHYQALVDRHGLELAPLAYNAGGNADAVKRAHLLIPSSNTETMGYAAIVGVILSRYLWSPSRYPR